jgi:hypothetical protein
MPIRQPKADKGRRISAPETGGKPASLGYPVFCLRNLQNGYDVEDMQADDQCAFIKKLRHLSRMEWAQVVTAPRHGAGKENIARHSLRVAFPQKITDDVTLWALRFCGMKAMVGWRNGDVFHLLWLDHNYTVYNH